MIDRWIFDFEVFAHDWMVGFLDKASKQIIQIWNDNDAVFEFMKDDPLLAGFNNKHYDTFIMQGVLLDMSPEEIKQINDMIIVDGIQGWDIPILKENRMHIRQYDLMDDCQEGLSLKAIEAHLGMDIRETTVAFDIQRPLTDAEKDEVSFYNKADLKATDALDDLRKGYLANKLKLAEEVGLSPDRALYMTNAKLTATYLKAKRGKDFNDEREYVPPATLKKEYIPDQVWDFFNRLHDPNIPDIDLFGGIDENGQKVKGSSLDLIVGGCPCTIAFGGIHGAIPYYKEVETDTRTIRNKDVASYYPHQMTLNHFCSRNIPDPQLYADTIERRVKAKHAGDKATSNALKLVLNTTYGAMLNKYNNLYDPLMGRSVCISGQLQLLELSEHLVQECPTLKIVQLNTDGIMVSLDKSDEPTYQEISDEWCLRTGFELEEDFIHAIIQRDVNNYIEVPTEGSNKIKGSVFVRGIAPVGAFNINNNMKVVAKAVLNYLADGVPIEKTVYDCNNLLDFQMIAKAGGKYSGAYQEVFDDNWDRKLVEVQKVNRVYAIKDYHYGTLYKKHATTGRYAKIPDLPANCITDNDNHLTIDIIDREWYIRRASRQAREFMNEKGPKRNGRKANAILKNIFKLLEE